MESFASELGVRFHHVLEANHVIDVHRQVWVGALRCGAKDRTLRTTYKTIDAFEYQGTASTDHCVI